MSRPSPHFLDHIFKARSLAVVGASPNPAKLGHMTLDSIIKGGYEGTIYPVNSKAEEVLGLKAYSSLADIPYPVDLAVILVPARFVPDVIKQTGEKNILGAVVLTAGFKEAGRQDLEDELMRRAKEGGVRVVGPNVQGINYLPNRLCAMFFPVITTRGPLTVITQSGSATAALSEWAAADGLGINAAVNLGNQADLTECDYLDFFADDQDTEAMAVYLEGVSRGRAFIKSARAAAARKPVVVLKSGRSAAGRQAAASHTGSLAGSHRVFTAACRQAGVVVAQDMDSLYDKAKALATIKPPKGPRLLSVSTSGGMGALAVDQAKFEGLLTPPLPQTFVRAFKEENFSALTTLSNPLDLGYVEIDAFRRALLLADAHEVADTILLNLGDPMPGAVEVVEELVAKLKASLAVSYLGGGAEEEKARPAIHRLGVPVFSSPERAVRGIGAAVWRAEYQRRQRNRSQPAVIRWSEPDRSLSDRDKVLTEPRAVDIISGYGLVYPDHRVVDSPEQAAQAAVEMGFPIVLKVVSPQATHKTEIGGVLIGIDSRDEAAAGFETLRNRLERAHPGSRFDGVLVCRQAPPGVEVIIGGLDDPVFGPTVMFGLGGTQAEVLADVSFRLPPLDVQDAMEMMREVKGFKLLQGWRGEPEADFEALAEILVNVSRMMTQRTEIRELDLNPVRAFQKGAIILDARIVVNES